MNIQFKHKDNSGSAWEEFNILISPFATEVIMDDGLAMSSYFCLVKENGCMYSSESSPPCNLSCDFIGQSEIAKFNGEYYSVVNCDFSGEEGIIFVQMEKIS